MSVKQVSKFLGIVFLVILCTLLFPQLRNLWLVWYKALGSALELTIDLMQIGLIAAFFAALLVPLEALGSWAGWYGDRIEPKIHPEISEESLSPSTDIVRYVVCFDGIERASFQEFQRELAAALPNNIMLIGGLIPLSVRSRPREVVFGPLFAFMMSIRDLLIVAVSADPRYGRIYNQRTAQVIYNSLIGHGYRSDSQIPITLIGFGAGAQKAMASICDLKQVLDIPIEVISVAGEITGNNNAILVEHFYHLVGDKDIVERLSQILSPRRWKVFFLSYWNRAKHMGKISLISLGPVGHIGRGGPMDENKCLPDGRTHLRQTVDIVSNIVQGKFHDDQQIVKTKINNYERYRQAAFNRPEYYPLNQSVNAELYRPIADWMGRLILPPKDQRDNGVLFEVHHADREYENLIGQVVYLKWIDDPKAGVSVPSMKKDVHFSEEALYNSRQGNVEPLRVNHWRQVTPLESLTGSRPYDDIVVMLHQPVVVEKRENTVTLKITSEPVQISGRFYALVKFLQPVKANSEQFRVVHFNRASGVFDGVEEVVQMPAVIPDQNMILHSNSRDIEKLPLNDTGWYIYGAQDASKRFVVQALAPRALLQVQPQEVTVGEKAAWNYVRKRCWQEIVAHKGQIRSVLLSQKGLDIHQSMSPWHEGDQALLIHVFGGIGGKKPEPAAKGPIYFGHCAYGVAEVVREPLTGELRFEIEYHQVYCHNGDGLVAGTLSWTRYMGDRQFGWLGIRPVSDFLIKFDALTEDYEVDGVKYSPLEVLVRQLEIMCARYRIGDGTGATFVGPANNCTQDANQALYAAIRAIQIFIQFNYPNIPAALKSNPHFKDWLIRHPELYTCFKHLVNLGKALNHDLLPFGVARTDWENSIADLGSSLEDDPLKQLFTALVSWRTILPHKASDSITQIFIEQGASVWVLSTSQVGNSNPDLAAVAPFTF